MDGVDRWANRVMGRFRGNPVTDAVMYGASSLGDDGRVWIVASLVRSRQHPSPVRAFARHMAWLGIESALVNGPAKGAVRRPRPVPIAIHPHRLRRPSNSSFPSGHAASAATMAMLLSEDGLAPLWWGLATTIAVSRIYVGVHHATDVAGGFAAGAAIGWAARHVRLPYLDDPPSDAIETSVSPSS